MSDLTDYPHDEQRAIAAEKLYEGESLVAVIEGDVYFPGGWEDSKQEIRDIVVGAAKAVIAEGLGPDKGTYVPCAHVASLINYLASLINLDS